MLFSVGLIFLLNAEKAAEEATAFLGHQMEQ
jgi:hypothetical protein